MGATCTAVCTTYIPVGAICTVVGATCTAVGAIQTVLRNRDDSTVCHSAL